MTETATPLIEVRNASDLVHNTLFLSVNFGSLGNTRKVEDDIVTTNADHDFIKVSKTLLDSKELKEIGKADMKTRTWLKSVCHPFEKGLLLVPFKLMELVAGKLKTYEAERSILVADFVAAYPGLIEQAKINLGTLYNPKDYPSPASIGNTFRFSWTFTGIGVPGEIRTISEKLFLEEKERQVAQFKAASEEITVLMRETLYSMVHSLQEKLEPTSDAGPRKRIHESGITKLQEFFEMFDLKNVTNDTELQAQVQQAKLLLTGVGVKELRTNEDLREKVRVGMESITNNLSTLLENTPKRMFREEEE